MTAADLTGDVTLEGAQIAEFCDLVKDTPQHFHVDRLRAATRITRRPSLGEREWRVTLNGQRGTVVVPIAGID